MAASRPAVVACGIFAAELSALGPGAFGGAQIIYLDSMLHMRPSELGRRLDERLADLGGRPLALAYGDCCPYMRELAELPGRARTPGVNCCEISLGKARYRELRRQGTFFFMPEWATRWREVFSFELGLEDPALARGFMQDTMKRLAYIDTGTKPVPKALLDEIAAYFDLPLSVERAGSDQIVKAVGEALERAAADTRRDAVDG